MSGEILNKKAGFNYFLKDKIEAGIALTGSEVKSIRSGSISLEDAYVRISNAEVFLVNCYVAPYKFAYDISYDPRRERKLLLNRPEIENLAGKMSSGNLTIVPTKVYTRANLVKVEIALASPKKKADKRASLKDKALQRETQAVLRDAKLKSQTDN